jgi:hypothetical protein
MAHDCSGASAREALSADAGGGGVQWLGAGVVYSGRVPPAGHVCDGGNGRHSSSALKSTANATTSSQQPAPNNQLPTTSSQQPAPNNQLPTQVPDSLPGSLPRWLALCSMIMQSLLRERDDHTPGASEHIGVQSRSPCHPYLDKSAQL